MPHPTRGDRLRAAHERSEAQTSATCLALDVLARCLGPDEVGRRRQLGSPDGVRAATTARAGSAPPLGVEALASELCVGVFTSCGLRHGWACRLSPTPAARRARRRLLASTDDSVAAIGAEVRWPDPSHFARRSAKPTGAAHSRTVSAAASSGGCPCRGRRASAPAILRRATRCPLATRPSWTRGADSARTTCEH
jgi:hypothetical protein